MPTEISQGLKIHKDIAKDVLMVEQVKKGKFGASQLRIAFNLTPVRALAKKILDDKVSDVMGRDTEAPAKAVNKLTDRLAVRGICGMSKIAGFGPFAAFAKQASQAAVASQGAKYLRVNKIVELYKVDKLKKYGGFDGLEKKMATKRSTEENALLAKGIPPQVVQLKMDRARAEDTWVLHRAAQQVGLEKATDEESTDEASGFRLKFWKKKKRPTIEQREAAAQAKIDAAASEQEARDLEQQAKDAQEALNNPPDKPDDKDAPDDSANPPAPDQASGERRFRMDPSNLTRDQLIRYLVKCRQRRMRRAQLSGASTAETAAASAVPGGPATVAVSKMFWKRGGKKHAAAGMKLAKARNGDPAAKAEIAKTIKDAKAGDPKAKAEVNRLKAVNKAAAAAHQKGFYSSLLRAGVAGKSEKTGSPTIEKMYGNLLSSGCT